MTNKAVVVLSGGQDSATCLAWAVRQYGEVHAITFYYGQRHYAELEAARKVATMCNVDSHHVVNMERVFAPISGTTALLDTTQDVSAASKVKANLPASYVPNRNALFLTAAHALAQQVGASYVVTGVCETDFSGYPDCRGSFIGALNSALNLGSEQAIQIITPLMHKTKADVWELADDLDALEMIVDHTLTCYNGDVNHHHMWGYGCGQCPACILRKNGFAEYQLRSAASE